MSPDVVRDSQKKDLGVTDAPLCTVVMGTYNRPKLLGSAIASVVKQTYLNWELIVVNDGGVDVRDVVDGFDDPRIRYVNLPRNFGAGHSYNCAITESTGPYITYLADDDVYYPNHIRVLSEALQGHPGYDVAYSDQYEVSCDLVDGAYVAIHDKVLRHSHDFDKLVLIAERNCMPHPCIMHRRSLLRKTGPYDETLPVLIDYDLIRKMAFYTDFFHVAEVTGEYFFPKNRKDRISDMLELAPERYAAIKAKVMQRRPDKPWDRLKELNLVLYTAALNRGTLDQLAYIARYVMVPHHCFVLMDGYDEQSSETLQGMKDAAFTPFFSDTRCGMEECVRKFMPLYGKDAWLMVLDEDTRVDHEWKNDLYDQMRLALAGKVDPSADLAVGRLSISIH